MLPVLARLSRWLYLPQLPGNRIFDNPHRTVFTGSLTSNSSRIGQTTVMYQSGLRISELPLVVKKVRDVLKILPETEDKYIKMQNDFLQAIGERENEETREIIAGLRRCFTVNGIFKLLETIPVDEVTPSVAVEALKLILTLESSPHSGNQGFAGLGTTPRITDFMDGGSAGPGRFVANNSRPETFRCQAFVNMILDIIYKSRNPKVLIDGLEVICNAPEKTSVLIDPSQLHSYKEKLFEEVLVQVTEGNFSLVQICDVISIVSNFYGVNKNMKRYSHELTDKLWSGLVDKTNQELSAETMVHVISVLPHLRVSRGVILNVVKTRLGDFWREYSTEDVLAMLKVLTDIHISSGNDFTRRAMPVISNWILHHIHILTEDQLLAVVYCYTKMEYVDNEFVSSLQKYVKVRCIQIEDANLVAAICEYCIDTRIRSLQILNGVSEYFTINCSRLTTPQLHSIARVFGELDYHPFNGFRFWDLLEHNLEMKFAEFPPKDIVKLLLSFVYIERYPLNFVRKLFNPYFLDRVHNQSESMEDVHLARHYLTLFDVAMNIDSPAYGGPFLPREKQLNVNYVDSRVRRAVNIIHQPMGEILGDVRRVGLCQPLMSLPSQLYVCDMIIYPSAAASLLRFGLRTDNSKCILVLIHTPDHYEYKGENLTGLQAMRVRHLKKMGFKVMQVSYSRIMRARQIPGKLQEILTVELEEASKPNT